MYCESTAFETMAIKPRNHCVEAASEHGGQLLNLSHFTRHGKAFASRTLSGPLWDLSTETPGRSPASGPGTKSDLQISCQQFVECSQVPLSHRPTETSLLQARPAQGIGRRCLPLFRLYWARRNATNGSLSAISSDPI